MTEWGVLLTIITLAGFLATIIKPITQLTKSITKLTDAMETLKKDFDSTLNKNTESHRRLWEHNTEQDEKIEDHEKRISMIEYDKQK